MASPVVNPAFGGATESSVNAGSSGVVVNPAFGTTLTPSQQLQLAYINAHKSKGNFLSDIAHGTGSILGKTLNILARPVDAVMGATTAGAAAGDKWNLKTLGAMAHGAKEGIEGKNYQGVKTPDTFSDYIKTEYPNFAKNHKVLTAVGGLAGEIAFDPTLPIMAGGTLVHAGELAMVAKAADLVDTGATVAARLKNTQEAVNALKDLGPAFDARRVYANLALNKNIAEQAAETIPAAARFLRNDARTQELTHAATAAARESASAGDKLLQAKYLLPFSGGKSIPLTPTIIRGVRVAPKVPTLARMARHEGVLGHLPLIPATADAVGRMFKHGFTDANFAKPALEAKHFEKHYNGELATHFENRILRPFRGMPTSDKQEALHFGETHHGVVTIEPGGARTFHPEVVAKSNLNPQQQAYLGAWHDYAEHNLTMSKMHGVQFAEDLGPKVYVPHHFDQDGGVLARGAVRSKMGFTEARKNELSLKQIAESVNGKVKDMRVETNPDVLGAMMSMNTAVEAAKTTMLRHVRLAAGVASRVPDIAKRTDALQAAAELSSKQDELGLLKNQKAWKNKTSRMIRTMHAKKLKSAIDEHGARVEAIHAQVAQHHIDLTAPQGAHTPAWTQFRSQSMQNVRKAIGHFNPADRKRALELHGLAAENRKLTARLNKLGDPKGGPATAHRALAEDVGAHMVASRKIDGRSVEDIEKLGTDRSKENIGYQAQPQGKSMIPGEKPKLGEQFKPTARGESWKENIRAALDGDRKGLQDRYSEISKKYPNAKQPAHLNNAARALARVDREVDRFLAKKAAIDESMRLVKNKADAKFEKDFETQARLHNSLQNKIDRKYRIAQSASMKNPDIPHDFVEWDRKIDDQRYHFPKEIHAAMTRMELTTNSDEAMKKLADGARNVMQKWKIGVTSLNPGYAARNHLSEVWNMVLDGIPIGRIAQYNAKTLKLINTVHKIGEKLTNGEELTGEEARAYHTMSEMAGHGILNGLFQGDIQEAEAMFNSKTRARDILRHHPNPKGLGLSYVRIAQDFNRNRENMNRITSFLYHKEYQGLSASHAADRTKASLFDYSELTPTEQGKFKLLIPFWTWTRKNIPYQLQHVLGRPGKFSSIAKIAETSNELTSGTPFGQDASEGTLPDWMKEGYGFRIPGLGQETYYQPNFGVNDLAKVEHPKTALSLLNPLAGIAYTVGTGTNSFTGQPVVGSHPRNPVAGWAADVLRYLPGSDVGQTARSVDGKEETGQGINPWYSYALSQLPETNLANSLSSIKTTQRGGIGFTLGQYVGGQPIYKRDIPSETIGAQLNNQTAEQRWARGLRDAGMIPQTKKKGTSAFQNIINQKISGG